MPPKAHRYPPVIWSRCRGRNGYDAPQDLPDDMAAEVQNVMLRPGGLGEKRYGCATTAITGGLFGGTCCGFSFVPGQDDTASEFHFISGDTPPRIIRVAAGVAGANMTLVDAITKANRFYGRTAQLNGKLFWCYDSAVNRLHVFDPNESTTKVRRVGLQAPAAPSVADTGAGAYAATLRYYRIVYLTIDGSSNVTRRSNLGTAQSFTPSGAGTHARVTKPASISEDETHWIVYGSIDGVTYYDISGNIAVGTTTYDDNADPNAYADNDAMPAENAYTPPPSAKYILSTGERLVMLGAWETTAGTGITPKSGRLYFTPTLDTTDFGDDERISNTTTFKGYADVGRNSGAEDRALAGPLDGQILAFQSRGVYLFVPTTDATRPFRRIPLSTGRTAIGAVSQESTFMGEDEAGRPCIYWLDPERGPYRYGYGGVQWCGYDVQDIWDTINLEASERVAQGIYYPKLRCCIWWLATGSQDNPDTIIAFFVREGRFDPSSGVRYGWVKWTGDIATSGQWSMLWAATPGATMSRAQAVWTGNEETSSIRKCLDSTATDDDTGAIQGFITSRAFPLEPMFTRKLLDRSWLHAKAAANVTITQTLIRNFGDQTSRTATADLDPSGSETRLLKNFDAAALQDAFTFQVQLGDASGNASVWTLDRWIGTIEPEEEQGNG